MIREGKGSIKLCLGFPPGWFVQKKEGEKHKTGLCKKQGFMGCKQKFCAGTG